MKASPLLLVVLMITVGCRHPANRNPTLSPRPPNSQATHLTETEAIAIAERVALRRGVLLADFQRPRVNFDYGKGEWWLWFDRKPPQLPGGYFGVCIEAATKEAWFIPGK
jgi:hypothetical protein